MEHTPVCFRAVLNIHWKKHPTLNQLYDKLPRISQVLRERRLRLAGHSWRGKNDSVLEHVESVLIPAIDALPDDDEIRKATHSLHNTASGNSGLPAQLWKALQDTEETFNVFCEIVKHFWMSECTPDDWNIGLLKILPKKGDLKLPGN